MHTVNHYSHVKEGDVEEAIRIHPHVIQHLKLCQQRMEQALEMLNRYPDIESKVRPEIGKLVVIGSSTSDLIRPQKIDCLGFHS